MFLFFSLFQPVSATFSGHLLLRNDKSYQIKQISPQTYKMFTPLFHATYSSPRFMHLYCLRCLLMKSSHQTLESSSSRVSPSMEVIRACSEFPATGTVDTCRFCIESSHLHVCKDAAKTQKASAKEIAMAPTPSRSYLMISLAISIYA